MASAKLIHLIRFTVIIWHFTDFLNRFAKSYNKAVPIRITFVVL